MDGHLIVPAMSEDNVLDTLNTVSSGQLAHWRGEGGGFRALSHWRGEHTQSAPTDGTAPKHDGTTNCGHYAAVMGFPAVGQVASNSEAGDWMLALPLSCRRWHLDNTGTHAASQRQCHKQRAPP